jgi:hypothetical protein
MITPEENQKKISPPADAPPFEGGLWNRPWFMILLCLVFVGLDWELIPLQVFPVVFVFPLMLVAWNRPLWLSAGCAVLLSLTRVLHQAAFTTRPIIAKDIADASICFFVLLLLALLTTQLGRQSRQLRQRVRVLEGLVPICSFCKNIRDDQQQWVRFEEYLSKHSDAIVSHGLCPDCARKHYSEFYPPKK